MNVVRENCRKFMIARFNRKREPRRAAWAGAGVAAGTYRRAISRKKIAAMTADTRCMARKISHIRIFAGRFPVRSRVFVTGAAIDFFVGAGTVPEVTPLSGRGRDKTRREYKRDQNDQK